MTKVFEEHQKELIDTINEEGGFAKGDVEDVVHDVLDGIEYYSNLYSQKENIKFPINNEVFPDSSSNIKFYPLGVIAQIGSWNFPLWQTMITVIPALLAGNSIIYKPSEKILKSGLLIHKVINLTKDLPENLFSLVIGDSVQGKYLVNSKVDCIVYTGNIEVGKKIVKYNEMIPKILELSGNDAAIVCADCDMEQAVNGIVSGAFLHSGEVCDRVKRIYVVKEIAEEFISKISLKISKLDKEITPLITLDHLNLVDSQVKKTIDSGAELLNGGERFDKKGFYYKATLLKLNNNDCYSVAEEIFGPVVSLLIVEDENQAIEFANSTEFGLGTSIWTQNFKKAEEIVDKCESGMVWVNDSNIPLVCGEYFKGWKSTSIPNASDRLNMFLKSKTVISFNSNKKRDWWF